MSKEKLVKKQAREALKGNAVPVIMGILVFVMALILAENIRYWFWIYFDAIDLELEVMNAGSDLPYYSVMAATVVITVALSPFFNGAIKSAANAVINKKNEFTDVLYFFKGAKRYFKTLLINMALFVIFAAPSSLLDNGLSALTDTVPDSNPVYWVLSFFAALVSVIVKFFLYAWFIHYPLCLYAVDDSRGAAKYIFGYIGFSFRHFGAFFKLFFSMFGWICLCFFVAPMFYVVPYYLAASINSARWLLKADEEKAAQRSVPQPMYQGFGGYGNYR